MRRTLAVLMLLAAPAAAQSPGTVNLVGPSGGGQPITPTAINNAVNSALMAKQDYPGGGGGSITWPASTDLVISNGTNSPAGLAAINGDCVVGAGGVWTVGPCPGGGGISGPGTTVNGFVPLWSGTTGSALSAGFAINAGAQTALGSALNGSGGLLGFSLIGTSGATIPLLNGNNTWAGTNTFSSTLTGTLTGHASLDLPLTGGTLTGKLNTLLSGTGGAGFNLPPGAAPTSPINGDLWTTLAGIYVRINGSTVGPLSTGGGSVSFTVDPTTPNLVFTPSPATGTAVLKSASPTVTSASSTYTFNGTGTSGTGAAIDNTNTILLTASSPTFVLGVAGATDFAANVGGIVMADGTTPLTITSSSTICGQASPVSFDARQAVSFAAGSGDWKCMIAVPPSIPSGTIASGKNLGLDSGGKIVVATIAAGGNVSNSGTPTANQLATWVDATHVQGVTTGANVVTALGVAIGSAGAFTPNNVVNTFTASQRVAYQTPTIATATFTPAVASGNNIRIGLTSACPCTLANFSGTLVAGQQGIIEVAQDSTGARTIGTWGSAYVTVGGTSTIGLSAAANAVDYLPYAVDSTATKIVLGAIISGPTH